MSERGFDELFPQHPNGDSALRRSGHARPAPPHPRQPQSQPRPRRPQSLLPQQTRRQQSQHPHQPRRPQSRRPRQRVLAVAVSLLALAAVVGGLALFVQSLPASITLNGTSVDVDGNKTIADALRASGIDPQPGDLLAIDGSMLEEGGGEPFNATLNGQPVADVATRLNSGDVLDVHDGDSAEEPSDTTEEPIPYTFVEEGRGPIHLIEGEGVDGAKRTRTGSVSGLAVEEAVQDPVNVTRRNVAPDVGGDKVIALTFDDGPWPESTAAILDVLAEHDAKATFFTVGNRIDGEGIDLVRRAADEGHQICTHSFSHAAGDGQSVNLGYMKPEDQVAEVQKGYDAIEAATGEEASRVFRAPGGNYGEDVMRNVGPLVSAEIGWNIDSEDWRKPGAGPIADQIKNAWPGSIVLMHDGGGDRSQTVEALDDALPFLKSQGYRFVTMDELMDYPLE